MLSIMSMLTLKTAEIKAWWRNAISKVRLKAFVDVTRQNKLKRALLGTQEISSLLLYRCINILLEYDHVWSFRWLRFLRTHGCIFRVRSSDLQIL